MSNKKIDFYMVNREVTLAVSSCGRNILQACERQKDKNSTGVGPARP